MCHQISGSATDWPQKKNTIVATSAASAAWKGHHTREVARELGVNGSTSDALIPFITIHNATRIVLNASEDNSDYRVLHGNSAEKEGRNSVAQSAKPMLYTMTTENLNTQQRAIFCKVFEES